MLSRCLDTLITDEVNNMQYLSNAQTFQKCFHEQQKHFLYTAYRAICSRIKFNINVYYLNINGGGGYICFISVFLLNVTQYNIATIQYKNLYCSKNWFLSIIFFMQKLYKGLYKYIQLKTSAKTN